MDILKAEVKWRHYHHVDSYPKHEHPTAGHPLRDLHFVHPEFFGAVGSLGAAEAGGVPTTEVGFEVN